MPDSPLLNTINSIVILSYLYFNIWITAPGYPSNTLIQYDRLELQQSKLLYLSSETSPEASQ